MSLSAPLLPTSNIHRWCQRLDGLWDLQIDTDGHGDRDDWAGHGLPDPTPVAVPASVQEQTVDRDQWRAVATWWYQRSCFVYADGRHHQLRFGAVWHRARVFWNGELIGEHRGGHLPFAVDLPPAASGHNGLLIVAVDNRLDYHGLPHGEVVTNDREEARLHIHGDVFPYTGIHRPVWLIGLPDQRIESVRCHWDGASLQAAIARAGHSGRWRVRLDNGDWLETEGDDARITVPEPRLWHPNDPQLSRLVVELLDDQGQPCDAYELQTGLRTIAVDRDGLRVNGERIQLRGAGYKEDGPVRGNALDEAQLVRDLQRLRWLGANSLRTAHHPFSEELLQCCDRLGILVIEELSACSIWIPDADSAGETIEINNIVHHQPSADEDRIRRVAADTLADHRRQAAELVARDDHHPCIVMWSIGNEIDTRSTAAREHLGTVASDLRHLDPTRPLTLAECVGPAETWSTSSASTAITVGTSRPASSSALRTTGARSSRVGRPTASRCWSPSSEPTPSPACTT